MSPVACDDEQGSERFPAGGGQTGGRRQWSVLLPPDLAQLGAVRDLVDEVADAGGLESGIRFRLKLAVHEAVVNAIQHGSGFVEPVRLTASLDDDRVCFAVADPGPTFDLATDVPPDLHDRGRGLLLMVKCVDALTQHRLPRGKEIRLVKRFR